MVQATFIKSVNSANSTCVIDPVNAAGEQLRKCTAHCFRTGGAPHRFVIGKARWPFDVLKWWDGLESIDDINKTIRYLLEETSRYKINYTHHMYTR